MPFARIVRETFLATPSPLDLGRKMATGANTDLPWQTALGHILRPYGEVVDEYFRSPQIKAAIAWMAAQSGPPPTEPVSGPFALWHPLYHEGGVARPRGGSGMLTQALRRHIEAHGGQVHTSAPVDEILFQGRQAVGVRVHGKSYTARAVVAGGHALDTFGKLMPPDLRPPGADNMRVGGGFGAILRLALSEPVAYANDPRGDGRVGLGLLAESVEDVNAAYGEYLKGRYSSSPPIVAMTFSAVDDTLAPPGGEVLWLWAQYFPYQLAQGTWHDEADRAADTILDTFERYAPGTRDKVVGSLFQHPLWLERELGLHRGNVMHLEMSIDQMFILRPFVGMAQYATHLKGLYLTGASTHPGGGIMGASGRNAARRVLKDLSTKSI
jgi:phytoene dehydrogenase-like protein